MSTELNVKEPITELTIEQMGSCFSVSNYSDAQRAAKTLAYSSMVPDTFKAGKLQEHVAVANCMIALDMALRLKMNPMMVMQNMYIVGGRPSWSASFLVAAINKSGLFKTPLRYKQTGQGDDFGCIAWAVDHSGEILESTRITIKMAKADGWYAKNGSKWQTMPEQMLKYRAASFFCRAYCPEVAMGMQTADENRDAFEPYSDEVRDTKTMDERTMDIINKAKRNKTNENQPQSNTQEMIDESYFDAAKRKIANATSVVNLNNVQKWYKGIVASGTGEIIADEESELDELVNEKKKTFNPAY